MYNGFVFERQDGDRIYYTIQTRAFNSRPYAVYINGSQAASFDTYIYRGACVRALKKLVPFLKARGNVFDIIGDEIIRN